MSTVFVSKILESMNIMYPVYGYHVKKGSISFMDSISFANFIIRNNNYKYLDESFGSYYHNLVNRHAYYDGNTKSNVEYVDYFWIFTDSNDNRVDIVMVVGKYNFHIAYGKYSNGFRNVEKPGMPVPYISRKNRRKKHRNESFKKASLIEQEIREELFSEFGKIKNMRTKKDIAVSMKKWVKKQRDSQTKSWKKYRNKQWDK